MKTNDWKTSKDMRMHSNITYTLSRYYQMNELFNYKMRRLQGTTKIVQCNFEKSRNNFFLYVIIIKKIIFTIPFNSIQRLRVSYYDYIEIIINWLALYTSYIIELFGKLKLNIFTVDMDFEICLNLQPFNGKISMKSTKLTNIVF